MPTTNTSEVTSQVLLLVAVKCLELSDNKLRLPDSIKLVQTCLTLLIASRHSDSRLKAPLKNQFKLQLLTKNYRNDELSVRQIN